MTTLMTSTTTAVQNTVNMTWACDPIVMLTKTATAMDLEMALWKML